MLKKSEKERICK